jgi:hypothetical protein
MVKEIYDEIQDARKDLRIAYGECEKVRELLKERILALAKLSKFLEEFSDTGTNC